MDNNIKFDLPCDVLKIIDTIRSSGHRADVVGGAVRDLFLGRVTSDYDITTDATPERVKEIFKDERTIDTGIKHGTVTVLLDGVGYEVTTYRVDGEYKDSRHPEAVTFTKRLEDDLARRDFTMNAIAYNPYDGITDPFFGREDIEKRIIRTVGDAEVRFTEDALRIIRALRFSSVLGFEIEDATRVAIKNKKELLGNVSSERIYAELYKLLSGRSAYSLIFDFPEVFSVIIPECELLLIPPDVEGLPCDPLVRLASLFALNSECAPSSFDRAMRRLKTDNKSRETYRDALTVFTERLINTQTDILFCLRDFGCEAVLRAIDIGILLGRYGEDERRLYEAAISSNIPYTVGDLAVGGRDMIESGLSGKEIGVALDRLLSLVILGKCENTKESLIEAVSGENLKS